MKQLCTTHFKPTSLKILRRIHRTNDEQLSAVSSSTVDGQFLLRTQLQIRNQMLSNAIQQREDEHVQRQIQFLSRHPKQHPSSSLAMKRKVDALLPPPPTSPVSLPTSCVGKVQLPPSSSVPAIPVTPIQNHTGRHDQEMEKRSSPSVNKRETTLAMKSLSSISSKPSTKPSALSKPTTKEKSTPVLSLPPPPPPSSSPSSSSEQCPICGTPFADDMDIIHRTKHVERCLSRSSSSSSFDRRPASSRSRASIRSSITSSRKTPPQGYAMEIDLTNSDGSDQRENGNESDDDLWDIEEDDNNDNTKEEDRFDLSAMHSRSSHASTTRTSSKTSRRDVKASRGKRVLIDDGEDRFYFSLLHKYLLWREASRSCDQLLREKVEQYHNEYIEQASVLNEWSNPSSPPSKEHIAAALKDYYLHEPAYLLQSGYLIPSHLYDSLYTYQKQGVAWMLGLHRQDLGGILADEMGLGKTLQVVATLITLKFSREAYSAGRDFSLCPRGDYEESVEEKEREREQGVGTSNEDNNEHSNHSPIRLETDQSTERDDEHKVADFNPESIPNLPSLFVVPATLLGHWMRELRCWCPLLRSIVVHSTSETMSEGATLKGILRQCNTSHRYQIILTTYEGMRSSSLYREQDWFYAVLDEGGKIKNSKVTVSQKSRLIRTQHRLLISGTPLQNNLKELWSLVDFVYPGKLGTQEAFVSTFVIPISRGIYSNASLKQSQLGYQMSLMLQDTINPYILRRLKKVCDSYWSDDLGHINHIEKWHVYSK